MNISRRWFRFRLRTIFVVLTVLAIPLGWAAYQLNWIRQRERFLASRGLHGYNVRDAPWPLGIFGARGFGIMLFDVPLAEPDVTLAKELFPEADSPPDGGFSIHDVQ